MIVSSGLAGLGALVVVVAAPVRVGRPAGGVEAAADQRGIGRQRLVGLVAGPAGGYFGEGCRVAAEQVDGLRQLQEEQVIAVTGELPGAPHPGTRYPRRPRDLGSGRLAVTGDRRPARDELARRGRLAGVAARQPLPGRGAGRFLVGQQRVGVVGGVVQDGELVVDPGRILGRSRDRQLHLVGAAVSVLAGEGVPVDLAPGEPGQAENRAETGQGGAPGLLAGEQQGRVGLADQRRQLAGTGQQRGAVRHRGGERVAGLLEQRPDLLWPQAGQHRGVGGLLDLGA